MPGPVLAAVQSRTAWATARPAPVFGAAPLPAAPTGATVILQAAPPKGLGYVQYSPIQSDAGVLFQAGQRVALSMPVGTPDIDTLSGPFAGWTFWSGSGLAARAVGDAYTIRLTILAQSSVVGGGVLVDATVNGAADPIETDQASLSAPAGTEQILSFHLKLYPKATFVAGGARIYITPQQVPVLITNSKLIIEPTNAG